MAKKRTDIQRWDCPECGFKNPSWVVQCRGCKRVSRQKTEEEIQADAERAEQVRLAREAKGGEILRDERGRLLPGTAQPNLLGRKPKRRDEDYLVAMSQVVTVEEWMEVVQRALDDAKDGKAAARTWLSNYLIGKPVNKVEIKQEGPIQDKTEEVRVLATVLRQLLEQRRDSGDDAVVIEGELS